MHAPLALIRGRELEPQKLGGPIHESVTTLVTDALKKTTTEAKEGKLKRVKNR